MASTFNSTERRSISKPTTARSGPLPSVLAECHGTLRRQLRSPKFAALFSSICHPVLPFNASPLPFNVSLHSLPPIPLLSTRRLWYRFKVKLIVTPDYKPMTP